MKKPLTEFGGLDNVNAETEIGIRAMSVADNVDFTRNHRFRLRAGRMRIASMAISAAWACGRRMLIQSGATLFEITEPAGAHIQRADELTESDELCALEVNGALYWSNGYQTGVIDGQRSRAWGMPSPDLPAQVDVAAGPMPPGRYLYTLTHVRDDGYESGAVAAGVIETTLPGSALTFSALPSAAGAVQRVLYLSTADGAELYLANRYSASLASLVYDGDTSALRLPLRTQFTQQPPPCSLIARHRGRLYLARSNLLLATRPLDFERVDPRKDYIAFPDPITMVESVDDGLYVGTEKQIFYLPGQDIHAFEAREAAGYGAIRGTAVRVDGQSVGQGSQGDVVLVGTPRGVCACAPGGSFVNLSERFLTLPQSATGCGAFIQNDGQNHYLCVLREAHPFNARKIDTMFAQIVIPALAVSTQA